MILSWHNHVVTLRIFLEQSSSLRCLHGRPWQVLDGYLRIAYRVWMFCLVDYFACSILDACKAIFLSNVDSYVFYFSPPFCFWAGRYIHLSGVDFSRHLHNSLDCPIQTQGIMRGSRSAMVCKGSACIPVDPKEFTCVQLHKKVNLKLSSPS